MEKFTTLISVAAPLPLSNIDTDQIIPAAFLKTLERTGLARGLFYALRHHTDGSPKDFVLDQPPYQGAKILVVGKNFGCGSSREHAPWALLDAGIRSVIAPSFADIFYNNCFKNGILPIIVSEEEHKKLLENAERGANATLTIDLVTQKIVQSDGETISFDIDPFRKHCLLNGLDDISLTLEKGDQIDCFEAGQRTAQPWLYQATSLRP